MAGEGGEGAVDPDRALPLEVGQTSVYTLGGTADPAPQRLKADPQRFRFASVTLR